MIFRAQKIIDFLGSVHKIEDFVVPDTSMWGCSAGNFTSAEIKSEYAERNSDVEKTERTIEARGTDSHRAYRPAICGRFVTGGFTPLFSVIRSESEVAI